jgi:hypothetical protein
MSKFKYRNTSNGNRGYIWAPGDKSAKEVIKDMKAGGNHLSNYEIYEYDKKGNSLGFTAYNEKGEMMKFIEGVEIKAKKDPNPWISGMYSNSWDNLGYHLRNLDASLDYTTNGGHIPRGVKFIAELNPLVSIPNAIYMTIEGKNIYNEDVSNGQRIVALPLELLGINKVKKFIGMGDDFLKPIIFKTVVNEAAK